MRARFHPRR